MRPFAIGSQSFGTQNLHEAVPQCTAKLSVVTVEGTPNLEIQPCRKAAATDSAVLFTRGMHLVNLSIQVSKYVCPLEVGSGPTKSMWMESNLSLGGTKVESGVTECRLTLALWQCVQVWSCSLC